MTADFFFFNAKEVAVLGILPEMKHVAATALHVLNALLCKHMGTHLSLYIIHINVIILPSCSMPLTLVLSSRSLPAHIAVPFFLHYCVAFHLGPQIFHYSPVMEADCYHFFTTTNTSQSISLSQGLCAQLQMFLEERFLRVGMPGQRCAPTRAMICPELKTHTEVTTSQTGEF